MSMPAASLLSLLLLSPPIDGWLGIYLDNERTEAVVVEVIPESPAAKAGLLAGDVLLAVGETATATREAFVAAVRAAKPGDSIAIKLRRGEQEQTIRVALGNRPEPSPAASSPASQPSRPERPAPATESAPPRGGGRRGYLGLSVREADGGVLIDRVLPDGPAEAAKLLSGERIVKVGDREVRNLVELDAALQGVGPGQQIAFRLQGESGERVVSLRLGDRPAAAAASAVAPGITVAPVAPVPAPAAQPAPQAKDVDAELAALRVELADLRRQLEELRRTLRRE